MCLVVASGTTFPELTLGLGTVHPNCKVSHYGFTNTDANAAWTDTQWTAFSSSNPEVADKAINLNFRFDSLDAGASVSFTWV
jgi:hypothetical protein